MLARDRSTDELPGRRVLDRLIRQRGLGRYALFFVTDDGEPAEDGSGKSSGFAVDDHGRFFYFAVGWGPGQRDGTLTDWEEVGPEPHWLRSAEYRQARAAVGLGAD
jgi:hypothetical protein